MVTDGTRHGLDEPLLLALDAGTSAGRALVVAASGRCRAEAARPWSYFTPADAAPWGREFAPAAFWALLCEAAREALAAAGSGEVVAVAATGQRQATILIGQDGRELYGGPNIDIRAGFEGIGLLHDHGPLLHRITGHLPPMMFASARWLWLLNHRPADAAAAAHLLMMADWVNYRLCGRVCTDATNAAETGLFDISRLCWSPELLSLLQVPEPMLAPVLPSGSVIGTLSPSAAQQLGLRPGIPVVLAGSDTACGMLGMGATAAGEGGVLCGWSAPAQVLTPSPVLDPEGSLWTTCSALPGQWAVEGNCGLAGAAHRWLRDLLCPESGYEAMEQLAAAAAPGCGGVLAFLGPRIADYANPQLLWGGLLMPQANDLLPMGRAEVARAILEDIAFAVRANWERLRALTNEAVTPPVHVGGGLTRSATFARILADVLRLPLGVASTPSVSALGACACAAAGVGLYRDVAEASRAMAAPASQPPTDRQAQAEYLDTYERWLYVYRSLQSLSASMQ